MTDVPINGAMRWKVRISAVLWFLLFVGFVLGVPVLISASPLIFGAVAPLALILALPVAWIIAAFLRGSAALPGWRASSKPLLLCFSA